LTCSSPLVTAAHAKLLSTVNSITPPSLFSLPCRAQLSGCPNSLLFITTYMNRVENTISNSNSIIVFIFVAVGTCLPIRCLKTGCKIPLFIRLMLSNSCIFYIAPSLWLFVPNGLRAYHHFFLSKGCTSDVRDRSHLPPHGSVFMMFTLQQLLLLPPCGHSSPADS
jgi:hypothetical protein